MMIVAAGNQLWVYNVVNHSNLIDAELRQGETKYERYTEMRNEYSSHYLLVLKIL